MVDFPFRAFADGSLPLPRLRCSSSLKARLRGRRGGDLSGGQQQLAIARAIILVEQYFEFAYERADTFTVLQRGEVTLSGGKDAIDKDLLKGAVSV